MVDPHHRAPAIPRVKRRLHARPLVVSRRRPRRTHALVILRRTNLDRRTRQPTITQRRLHERGVQLRRRRRDRLAHAHLKPIRRLVRLPLAPRLLIPHRHLLAPPITHAVLRHQRHDPPVITIRRARPVQNAEPLRPALARRLMHRCVRDPRHLERRSRRGLGRRPSRSARHLLRPSLRRCHTRFHSLSLLRRHLAHALLRGNRPHRRRRRSNLGALRNRTPRRLARTLGPRTGLSGLSARSGRRRRRGRSPFAPTRTLPLPGGRSCFLRHGVRSQQTTRALTLVTNAPEPRARLVRRYGL